MCTRQFTLNIYVCIVWVTWLRYLFESDLLQAEYWDFHKWKSEYFVFFSTEIFWFIIDRLKLHTSSDYCLQNIPQYLVSCFSFQHFCIEVVYHKTSHSTIVHMCVAVCDRLSVGLSSVNITCTTTNITISAKQNHWIYKHQ